MGSGAKLWEIVKVCGSGKNAFWGYSYILGWKIMYEKMIKIKNLYDSNVSIPSKILEQFGIENYTWRLDIVQNPYEFRQFFLYDFLGPKFFNTPQLYATIFYQLIYGFIT